MFPVVSLNHAKTGAGGPPTPDMGTAEFPFSAETVERVRALSWGGPVERTPIEYDPTLVLTPHNRHTIIAHIEERDGRHCFYCGNPIRDGIRFGLVVEHVTPRRRGGSDLIENLVLAHNICNFEKSTAPGWFFVFRLFRGVPSIQAVGLDPSINDYGLSKRPGPHPCDVDLQRDLEPKRRERR